MIESLVCPDCGSRTIIPIVYGNMREREMDLAYQQRIYLGSSLASSDASLWYCLGCHRELPPEMGNMSHSSPWSDLHSKVLKTLRHTYKPLSPSERRSLRS